jgi:molybdopterin-binding protein
MREGRLVAEGSPDDILGLPADEWVAAFVGMQPPLHGRVIRSDGGLSEISVGAATVVTARSMPEGASVIAAVRPEDVTLFEAGVDLPAGSARNHLASVVVEIRPQGGTMLVVLDSGGAVFAASVSRASAAELDLTVGSPMMAVFKATAVRARLEG